MTLTPEATPVVSKRLGYRPALDGLRAVAIGLVLLDHVHPTLFKGGQVGVDVFFPLSGFLITTLILEEMASPPGGRFAFRRFWLRRVLRLFPALYAMLAAAAVFYLVIRNQTDFQLGKNLAWLVRSALYVSNLGGFEAEVVRLGHTWTLGVEEQFYLLWPPLLVLGLRARRKGLLLAALCAYVAWGVGAGWLGRYGVLNVVGPHNAALAAGCVAAMARWGLAGRRVSEAVGRLAPALAWPAMALVVGSLGVYHVLGQGGYDRWFVFVAGVGGALLVVGVVERPDGQLARLLSLPPVVFVGRLSYSLYVWHALVYLVVAQARIPGVGGPAVKMALSAVVATMSYYWIERPFLRIKQRYASG